MRDHSGAGGRDLVLKRNLRVSLSIKVSTYVKWKPPCLTAFKRGRRIETRALMSAVNDLGADNHPIGRSADYDERVLVEAELLDVGDQALIRGLDTAFPILRPGLFLSYYGRRRRSCRPQSANGSSPTVVPPPPMRER
jgi:hypothetical protein